MSSSPIRPRILLGVTGGIAAYKAAELVRLLVQQGMDVQVVMTEAAKAFIQPLTFQSLSGRPVYSAWNDAENLGGIGHIQLARWADHVLIAPASADFMARLRIGLGNDLLSTICLATQSPLWLAPAMNQAMWSNPATQENRRVLEARGIQFLGPVHGDQACGETGPGRLMDPEAIAAAVAAARCETTDNKRLDGIRVMITAGPTREALDPVRYISNHSSGRMGYALAAAAVRAGAAVTLVSGPVQLQAPSGLQQLISVQSARAMHEAVLQHCSHQDIFIGCAAVADYAPTRCAPEKIKKHGETMQLLMQRTPDILGSVARLHNPPFLVGFAAETTHLEAHALSKLENKGVDILVANEVGGVRGGFNSEDNAAFVCWKHGSKHFPLSSKVHLAQQLINLIAEHYHAKHTD